MRIFRTLYDKMLQWADHKHAPIYLACLSFSEASFFPLPPDLMLAPMAISQPQHAWRYAGVTTLCSVLGGIVGYLLGMFFITFLEPYFIQLGYHAAYLKVQHWFLVWGFYALFISGFTPIPYKFFTIASGAVGLPLLPFILASLVGRGSRFYLVSGLMRFGGSKMKDHLRAYSDWIGYLFMLLLIIIVTAYYLLP